MLILLSNIVQLSQYVEIIPDIAYQLIECSVEPITIIYPNAKNLPFEIINKDNSIGIRITKDAFCQNLINNFKKPLISTSANISGEKTPLNFQSISDEIKQNVDYIVDLETNSIGTGKASSIIKIEINGEFKIIRY
jgi:L-threonylcarbamoyladenylate synthase